MTISCNQSKNQSHIELKKSMRTNSIEEREGTTVTKHDRVKDACRILNDMSSLVEYMLYGMNNDLIEQLITGLEGDPSFNYFDFLINELGVEQSLVNSIIAYEPGELQMIEYEIEYPASNGLIYSLYLN